MVTPQADEILMQCLDAGFHDNFCCAINGFSLKEFSDIDPPPGSCPILLIDENFYLNINKDCDLFARFINSFISIMDYFCFTQHLSHITKDTHWMLVLFLI